MPVAYGSLTMTVEEEIQAIVDRETDAWNRQDAQALVSLFHPDMVWPWPPDSTSHDPETWVFPRGRIERSVRIVVSEQGDGAFAVVDVDTLWRHRTTAEAFHWKGRACKGYTKTSNGWFLALHTGLLSYDSMRSQG